MEKRQLGAGLTTPAIGLGCMGMSEFYGQTNERESVRTIHRAVERGVTLLDTADVYGRGANEELIGRAIREIRSQVLVATKFGHIRSTTGEFIAVDGSAAYVRRACEASLRRLQTDVIDLYQQHRVDPRVPIEETVGAMHQLVLEGKARHIGLSEAAPQDIRRAAAVAPLATVQSEYAVFTRDVERSGVLDCCEQLGIGFLAYAPLGRGLLTRRIAHPTELDPSDSRRTGRYDRFAPEHFERNLERTHELEQVAAEHNATPAQVSLAWLLSRRPFIVPIPGTKHYRYVEENAAAADLRLSSDDLARLEAVSDGVGERQSRGDPMGGISRRLNAP